MSQTKPDATRQQLLQTIESLQRQIADLGNHRYRCLESRSLPIINADDGASLLGRKHPHRRPFQRLAISGDVPTHPVRNFSVLFCHGLERVEIDAFQRQRVEAMIAFNRIILAVELDVPSAARWLAVRSLQFPDDTNASGDGFILPH